MVRLEVFTYIWQEDVAKIPKVLGAPGNIMVSRRNHLCSPFFNNNDSPRQFLRDEILLKTKLAWEMLLEQIIEFFNNSSGRH